MQQVVVVSHSHSRFNGGIFVVVCINENIVENYLARNRYTGTEQIMSSTVLT